MHHQPYREYSRNIYSCSAQNNMYNKIRLFAPNTEKFNSVLAYNIHAMQEFSFQILAGKSNITYTMNAMYHRRLEKTYYFCAS